MTKSEQAYPNRLTLLRNWESTHNEQGACQGPAEYDLRDKDRSQVKALANYWHAQEINSL
jgi:broad specificity phosphatase PhoE